MKKSAKLMKVSRLLNSNRASKSARKRYRHCSMANSLSNAGLFLVILEGELGGMPFVVDSGSDENVMMSYAYEAIKRDKPELIKSETTQEQHMTLGVGGPVQVGAATYVEIAIHIAGVERLTRFQVVNASEAMAEQTQKLYGAPLCGMLGVEFLVDNKMSLDFERAVARISA